MIDGLIYIPEFISRDTETSLITDIDKSAWNTDISRRRQQYGVEYDIRSKDINKKGLIKIPPIPEWLCPVISKIIEGGFMNTVEQAIINEYKPGQGIAAHTDSPVFGDVVASISLLSDIVMKFENDNKVIEKVLERRSLLLLSGNARHTWKHSIEKKYKDKIDNINKIRARRVSITLRSLRDSQ